MNASLLPTLLLFSLIYYTKAQCPAVDECLAENQTCSVLHAPFSSEPATSKKGWDLTKIRENVWSFYNGEVGSLITFDNGILLVVDAPRSAASFLEDGRLKQNLAINSVLKGASLRLVRLVYGHRHYDHIGTMHKVYGSLRAQYPAVPIEVYANKDTVRYLNRDSSNPMPKVTNIVPYKGMFIESSRDLTHRLYVRRGHTMSDMIVHIPNNENGGQGIGYLVDYVTTKFVPWYSIGVALDFFSVRATLRFMLTLDFETFVPGHGFLGDKQDIRDTLAYISDTLKFSKEAEGEITGEMLEAVNFNNIFTPGTTEYGNRHYTSKVFVDYINDMCTRKLIAKYGCKLGGIAVMGPSHCQAAYTYQVIETFEG